MPYNNDPSGLDRSAKTAPRTFDSYPQKHGRANTTQYQLTDANSHNTQQPNDTALKPSKLLTFAPRTPNQAHRNTSSSIAALLFRKRFWKRMNPPRTPWKLADWRTLKYEHGMEMVHGPSCLRLGMGVEDESEDMDWEGGDEHGVMDWEGSDKIKDGDVDMEGLGMLEEYADGEVDEVMSG